MSQNCIYEGRCEKSQLWSKIEKIKGFWTFGAPKSGGVGVRSSKLESMGIRYVFEHIFMDLCKFFIFLYFFDPEPKVHQHFRDVSPFIR